MTAARSRAATTSVGDAQTSRLRIVPDASGDGHISDRGAISVELLRLGWGSVLLLAPDTALRAAGAETSALARGISRTLGARQVFCALAIGSSRFAGRRSGSCSLQPLLRRVVAGVDGTHAATAVVFGAVTGERRAWLLDALIAAAFAVETWRTAT
jgi:hypothetical protein